MPVQEIFVLPWLLELAQYKIVFFLAVHYLNLFVLIAQQAEVEFLEEIQTEVLRVFLLAIHRHLYLQILLPSFSFLGLEISTALPCDFYSNSWGGGDVRVNKYLDH